MIAVSDTSPICYLILIGEIEILPKLYSNLLLPPGLGSQPPVVDLCAAESRRRDRRHGAP